MIQRWRICSLVQQIFSLTPNQLISIYLLFSQHPLPSSSSCDFGVDVFIPHVVDGAACATHDDSSGSEEGDQLKI